MNATATLVLDTLTASGADHSVKDLAAELSKSDTTIRKAIKDLGEQVVAGADKGTFRAAAPAVTEDAPTDQPAKKRYTRHSTPTTRTTRLNQITKSEVQVALSEDADLDDADLGKWVTICHTHNQHGYSDHVKDAHYLSTYPTFCTECDKVLNPADGPSLVGRRRKAAEAA